MEVPSCFSRKEVGGISDAYWGALRYIRCVMLTGSVKVSC